MTILSPSTSSRIPVICPDGLMGYPRVGSGEKVDLISLCHAEEDG
jgi:hypothetical protein